MKYLLVLLATLMATSLGAPNECGPGPTTPRADVDYLNTEEFEINENSLTLDGGDRVDSSLALAGATIDMDMAMTPEALVPQYHNSTSYVWFTGLNGAGGDVPADTCGFTFAFDMDVETLPQVWDQFTIPIGCLTVDPTTTASWPITFESDIEVWYCYDKPNTCDRVLPADVGFSAGDPLSLFNEPLCQGPLVFKMSLSVNPGTLDENVTFALDYVRDEVTTTDPFFSVDGASSLANPIDWSICDEAESGFVDFADCLARMDAYGGAKRVLELSVPGEDAKEIDLVFGLAGADTSMVDATHPLTIDTSKSYAWLYHYPNNPLALDSTVSTCFTADGCTDVTAEAVLTPSNDVETGHTKMKLHAFMPDFDSAYRCDEGYCVLVLRLNFLSANQRRSLGEVTTTVIYKDGSLSRILQNENAVPATQGMRIGVDNPQLPAGYVAGGDQTSDSSSGLVLAGIGAGVAALIIAGVVHKKNKSKDQQEGLKEKYVVEEPELQSV